MIEILGWVGNTLFAFCAAPQAYKSYKDGHSDGIASLLLFMWGTGEILTLAYVILKHGLDLPLITNYLLNLLFIAIISKYKLFPRSKDGSV